MKVSPKKYLIAVGRLSQVKNYPFMINAFAQLKKSVADFDYNLVIFPLYNSFIKNGG